MVQYKGRSGSENVVSKRTTFEDNRYSPTNLDVGLPDVIDRKNIEQTVSFRQTNRMMSDPKLYDLRFDEFVFDENRNVSSIPRQFILDSFKQARQSGFKMPWNSFKKVK